MMSDIKLNAARFKVRRAGQDSKESQRAHKYSKDDPNRCFVTIHTDWDRAVWAMSHPIRSAEVMCGFCSVFQTILPKFHTKAMTYLLM